MSTNTKREKKKNSSFQQVGDLFSAYQPKQDKGYITQEFQEYGYRLAADLGDLKHKSLYIKLAKNEKRSLLEQAKRFVIDAKADNMGALFMWKLKELRKSGAEE